MKKFHKWCILMGVALVGILALTMVLGSLAINAAPGDLTPTVTVNQKLDLTVPGSIAVSVDPGSVGTNTAAVAAKGNVAWQVTVAKSGGTAGDLKSATTGDTIPSANFLLSTNNATNTVTDWPFPGTAGVCLGNARSDITSTFTYKVDLTGVWTIGAATDYTCLHTYTLQAAP